MICTLLYCIFDLYFTVLYFILLIAFGGWYTEN